MNASSQKANGRKTVKPISDHSKTMKQIQMKVKAINKAVNQSSLSIVQAFDFCTRAQCDGVFGVKKKSFVQNIRISKSLFRLLFFHIYSVYMVICSYSFIDLKRIMTSYLLIITYPCNYFLRHNLSFSLHSSLIISCVHCT